MTEKYKRYFNRMIAELVCDKTERCAQCDEVLGLKYEDECPKNTGLDTVEYNAFVLSFAKELYDAVLQERKLYFNDLEVDTTEILELFKEE